jgi:hypothetical protein
LFCFHLQHAQLLTWLSAISHLSCIFVSNQSFNYSTFQLFNHSTFQPYSTSRVRELNHRILRAMDPISSPTASGKKAINAIKRATTQFKFCPNRIWSLAQSLPDWQRYLPHLIPKMCKIGETPGHRGHTQCTFDFCEYSTLDFTAVAQHHELAACAKEPCKRLEGLFLRDLLDEAALEGSPTAWKLDGHSLIAPTDRYMAISHIWSDGTGTGSWPEGQVNLCLYEFFREIAERFQCEGIWWDTLCIPREKSARTKAINTMQSYYEDTRITLVHNCFLREWEWTDAETACFAILVSPWFSRGWTALELTKSRKVKVIFKAQHGPIIKDLDEDILTRNSEKDRQAKAPPSSVHDIASEAIRNLRRIGGITEVNELLSILSARHTSWPKDKAVIAALLTGIHVPRGAMQQQLYQNMLQKVRKLSHGHIFHNSATMPGTFGWCPTNLLDIPLASTGEDGLEVLKDGRIRGSWYIGSLSKSSDIITKGYIWKGTHPYMKLIIELALKSQHDHLFLVEPTTRKCVERAVLAKVRPKKYSSHPRSSRNQRKSGHSNQNSVIDTSIHCQFVGSVEFHPPLPMEDFMGSSLPWEK